MAAGSASVDTMLAYAIAKLDSMSKRMDALETGEGHKIPTKKDSAKADDDDDKKDDATTPKKKILDDDDDDDKKDDSAKKADAKKADDDDDDKKDDAFPPKKKAKDDDGELEIKHEPKKDSKKADAAKKDATKKDSKKADDKKADDDDDRRDDDDDDDRKDSAKADDDDDKKDDAAKADSAVLHRMITDQAATIRRLESLMKPKSDDEHAAFADAQARADAVFNGFGQRAPRPLEGEELLDYRKRLAIKLKSHSPVWKSVKKFSSLPEEAFDIAEGQIYADAITAASNPTDLESGELRQVTKTDPTTGVRTIVFYGKDCFVKQMGRPGRRVAAFRTLASQ
jgi:hypothetical protein